MMPSSGTGSPFGGYGQPGGLANLSGWNWDSQNPYEMYGWGGYGNGWS